MSTCDAVGLTEEELLVTAASDFGNVRSARPRAVVRPRRAQDVAEAVRWAGTRGLSVAAQGRRHSVYGRGQVDDGLVVDLTTLDDVVDVVDVRADRVVVEAGATWRQVLAATLSHGLAPPVLPDYLDISVGGTIAVGGIGGATPAQGFLTDHVLELDVVTGAGDLLTCSARERSDLFDAVRAGLGQVALVVRATVALTPVPDSVRMATYEYDDLSGMLADARVLAAQGAMDVVQGSITPGDGGWVHRLDVGTFVTDDRSDTTVDRHAATLTPIQFLDRLAALEAELRSAGRWRLPHPWLMTFVGDSAVEQLLTDELARLDPRDLGVPGQVVVNAVRPGVVRTPLVRLPAEPLCFTVNLVRLPTTDDPDEIARLVRANRATYERVRAAGGVLYPVSALPMTASDWRRHLGTAYDGLAAARRTFDPAGLLTPGYEIFVAD